MSGQRPTRKLASETTDPNSFLDERAGHGGFERTTHKPTGDTSDPNSLLHVARLQRQ